MGVPMIRCQCAVCQSTDPRDQRMRSSIYVQSDDRSWIVDTGAEFRIQALRQKIKVLDAVLYSHSHADHIMGFDDLRRFGSTESEPIPIYASKETMNHLEKAFAYAFNGTARFPGYLLPEPHLIDGPFRIGQHGNSPHPGRTWQSSRVRFSVSPGGAPNRRVPQ